MLTYGAEVWGIMADQCTIERVHLFPIKRLLNVSTKTPSALVYGQTRKYSLYVITYVKCITYWLNLVRMPENRLPMKAYKILYALHFKMTGFHTCALHCTDTGLDLSGKPRCV